MNNLVISSFPEMDTEAFTLIYNRYWQALYRNISKIIFQQDIAEDILHDVFFKLWENKYKLRDESSIASWLFAVSYNMSISYIRRLIKEKKYISVQVPEITEDIFFQQQDIQIGELREELLHDAIRLLPERKKRVFELCKLQGKSYAEAGAILGISPNTVREYMTASIKFVKRHVLEKYASESVVALFLLTAYLQ
jgi:RNA polymerase sigma-70 factor (ECF subfamily)